MEHVIKKKDEKVLEIDGEDNCITSWIYLMPLSCTFKK
jgi:hypothetical protein